VYASGEQQDRASLDELNDSLSGKKVKLSRLVKINRK